MKSSSHILCFTEKQALADDDETCKDAKNVFNNVTLGSQQKSTTVQDLLDAHANCGEKLHQFRNKLQDFLCGELSQKIPADNLIVHLSTKVLYSFSILS